MRTGILSGLFTIVTLSLITVLDIWLKLNIDGMGKQINE